MSGNTSHPDKDALRRRMRSARLALAREEHARLSQCAAQNLLGSALWRGASCVALYVAVRGELETTSLLEAAWRERKQVLLPLCLPRHPGFMRLVACSGFDRMAGGPFGIPQPVESAEQAFAAPLVPDLIVTPGLAFDCAGARLGMGGGYYDRLFALPLYAQSLRLGLAFSFQIVDCLPRSSWDMPVQALCTELGCRKTGA